MAEREENAVLSALRDNKLTLEEIEAYERELVDDPENLVLRARLLGYYFLNHYKIPECADVRNSHILWVIANVPEAKMAGVPEITIHPGVTDIDDLAYHKAKTLWLEHAQQQPTNATILINAANFFANADREIADTLLKQGQALEPDNAYWLSRRAFLMFLNTRWKTSSEQRRKYASESLSLYEQAMQLEYDQQKSSNESHSNLMHAGEVAFYAEDFGKTRFYAEQMLKWSARRSSEAADMTHRASTLLGRMALLDGDIEGAKSYLLRSADVSGSPVLGSFGPTMELAKELLIAGETETVLQYFDKCALFWEKKWLTKWSNEVKRGKIPRFEES